MLVVQVVPDHRMSETKDAMFEEASSYKIQIPTPNSTVQLGIGLAVSTVNWRTICEADSDPLFYCVLPRLLQAR